jgi:adenylosuccinate lyase
MIERYNPPEIAKIWDEEEKFRRFLEIEKLLCRALETYKKIPPGISKSFAGVKISVPAIKKIEEQTQHDIVAFLQHISPQLGRAAKYLHMGMTSSDLLDTTLAWQLRDATEIILSQLGILIKEVKDRAIKHKDMLCIARTHGVHAEIYSFGLKFLYFYNDLIEEQRLLRDSLKYVACGKISGAVGTFAYHEPKVEEYICRKLGINHTLVSTQVVSRERFAYYLSLLALLGATLERFATEVRHLHRTEVDEVKEPFYAGQKGSSAMPHKQNPVICERICGLSRLLRANSQVAFENINLWHERDISHSSSERVILPDSTAAIAYMLKKMIEVVENLKVNPQNMMRNIELNRGLIYSQKILLKLMSRGLSRMDAYEIVQDISLKVINGNSNFQKEVSRDNRIKKYLMPKEIEEIFDPHTYLINVDKIYKRTGI